MVHCVVRLVKPAAGNTGFFLTVFTHSLHCDNCVTISYTTNMNMLMMTSLTDLNECLNEIDFTSLKHVRVQATK